MLEFVLYAALLENTNSNITPPFFFKMVDNLDLRCVLISGRSTLGAGAKTRLESRIKKFTPQCVYGVAGVNREIVRDAVFVLMEQGTHKLKFGHLALSKHHSDESYPLVFSKWPC